MTTDSAPATPLQPRRFFAHPWSGRGDVRPRGPLRLLPFLVPGAFDFTSRVEWLTDATWLVHDETRYDRGQVDRRLMFARLVAPDRIRVMADDMPGGAELRLRADGFSFTPYVLRVPFGPLRIPIRCRDEARIDAEGAIVDEIEIRVLGVPVAHVHMRLFPEGS